MIVIDFLFIVFFVLFMTLIYRLVKVEKGSYFMRGVFHLGWIVSFLYIFYFVIKNPPMHQVGTFIGIVLGIENLSLATGNYGFSKMSLKMVRSLLIVNSIFIVFGNVFLLNLRTALPNIWIDIIMVCEILIIIWNILICKLVKTFTHYAFLILQDVPYPVFNELTVKSGYDDSNRFQFTIPLHGNFDIENGSLITKGVDNENVYCALVDGKAYEVCKDVPISVRPDPSEDEDSLTFVTITVNETPISCDVRDPRFRKSLF